MLLKDQLIPVKWHPSNKKYYEEKGYKFTKWKDVFYIKLEDISKKSRSLVQVQCDYCNNVFQKKYQNYVYDKEKSVIKKDCCKSCIPLKNKEVFNKKYNANGPYGVKEIREKIEQTNLEKHGYKNPLEKSENRKYK